MFQKMQSALAVKFKNDLDPLKKKKKIEGQGTSFLYAAITKYHKFSGLKITKMSYFIVLVRNPKIKGSAGL